jgi:hypothetical protein
MDCDHTKPRALGYIIQGSPSAATRRSRGVEHLAPSETLAYAAHCPAEGRSHVMVLDKYVPIRAVTIALAAGIYDRGSRRGANENQQSGRGAH